MNAKEQWIYDTENSLQGLKSVEPNPYLYSKIMNRIQGNQEIMGSKNLVWFTVSSLLILAVLNVIFMQHIQIGSPTTVSEIQVLAEQYEILNTTTFNYQ